MSGVPWITQVRFGGGVPELWMIMDIDEFVRRWQRAMRRGELLPVRCAGRDMLLNPRQIAYVMGYPEPRRRRWWRRS